MLRNWLKSQKTRHICRKSVSTVDLRELVMEEIAKRSPIDKTAALVVSRGVQYESGKVILTEESIAPFPMKKTPADTMCLIGVRRCRLVVLGMAADRKGKWVCRCDCGMYVLRKSKALRNEANMDRCEECRQLSHLKRQEEFLRLGRNSTSTGWE